MIWSQEFNRLQENSFLQELLFFKRVGINATKFEKANSFLKKDVFAVVAFVVAKFELSLF